MKIERSWLNLSGILDPTKMLTETNEPSLQRQFFKWWDVLQLFDTSLLSIIVNEAA